MKLATLKAYLPAFGWPHSGNLEFDRSFSKDHAIANLRLQPIFQYEGRLQSQIEAMKKTTQRTNTREALERGHNTS